MNSDFEPLAREALTQPGSFPLPTTHSRNTAWSPCSRTVSYVPPTSARS